VLDRKFAVLLVPAIPCRCGPCRGGGQEPSCNGPNGQADAFSRRTNLSSWLYLCGTLRSGHSTHCSIQFATRSRSRCHREWRRAHVPQPTLNRHIEANEAALSGAGDHWLDRLSVPPGASRRPEGEAERRRVQAWAPHSGGCGGAADTLADFGSNYGQTLSECAIRHQCRCGILPKIKRRLLG
jgi:hypothetical protein